MATLEALREAIEAGKTVEKQKEWAEGYVAAYKSGSQYVAQENFEFNSFETFKQLYEFLEPDADYDKEHCPEFLDIWEVQGPLTEEQQQRALLLSDAVEQKDQAAIQNWLATGYIQVMERELFTASESLKPFLVSSIKKLHATLV